MKVAEREMLVRKWECRKGYCFRASHTLALELTTLTLTLYDALVRGTSVARSMVNNISAKAMASCMKSYQIGYHQSIDF